MTFTETFLTVKKLKLFFLKINIMVSSSLIQVQKKNGKVEPYQVDKITSFFQKIVPSKTDVIE